MTLRLVPWGPSKDICTRKAELSGAGRQRGSRGWVQALGKVLSVEFLYLWRRDSRSGHIGLD